MSNRNEVGYGPTHHRDEDRHEGAHPVVALLALVTTRHVLKGTTLLHPVDECDHYRAAT